MSEPLATHETGTDALNNHENVDLTEVSPEPGSVAEVAGEVLLELISNGVYVSNVEWAHVYCDSGTIKDVAIETPRGIARLELDTWNEEVLEAVDHDPEAATEAGL